MNRNKKLKAVATIAALFLSSIIYAQAGSGTDALAAALGKSPESQEFKDLQSKYQISLVTGDHYQSAQGIELILKNGVLNEINLYNKGGVYGSFAARLPKGLAFGMDPAEVKRLLGKPTTDYTSGYSEFNLTDCLLSCWFDGGKLSQLSLSQKSDGTSMR